MGCGHTLASIMAFGSRQGGFESSGLLNWEGNDKEKEYAQYLLDIVILGSPRSKFINNSIS
jgi:hypothetical protein